MSPVPQDVEETDFNEQMKTLAAQAEHRSEGRTLKPSNLSMVQMLRPLVLGLEALGRATSDNTVALQKLQEATASQDTLPALMVQIQEALENKTTINQQLFDALHAELSNYKDGFLAEVMHKPIIHDLISLHDDISEVHRQMSEFVAEQETRAALDNIELPFLEKVRTVAVNLDHGLEFLLEILARIEVRRMPVSPGRLDKAIQRAVSIELADSAEEDGLIAQSVKPGFSWKDRLVRPEEVVVKRWKEGFVVALNPNPAR